MVGLSPLKIVPGSEVNLLLGWYLLDFLQRCPQPQISCLSKNVIKKYPNFLMYSEKGRYVTSLYLEPSSAFPISHILNWVRGFAVSRKKIGRPLETVILPFEEGEDLPYRDLIRELICGFLG